MTLPAFTPTNTNVHAAASKPLAPAGRVASNVGRIFRNAAAALGKAVVILVAYRVALNRLEAGVEGDLFDEPVLWAELKSVAWAEAGAVAAIWVDRLPFVGAITLGLLGVVLAMSVAALPSFG
jgi:hypothetical protein